MILLWLLSLCFFIAFCGVVLAVITIIIRFIRRPDSSAIRSWWVGGPLGCALLPLIIFAGLGTVIWALQAFRPASSDFEEVFQTSPSATIQNLRGETYPGIDSRQVFLAFDRSDAAWQEMMRLTGNRASARKTDFIGSLTYNGNAPVWWKAGDVPSDPNRCHDPIYHTLYEVHGWDDLVIIDCRSDDRIYVVASNID